MATFSSIGVYITLRKFGRNRHASLGSIVIEELRYLHSYPFNRYKKTLFYLIIGVKEHAGEDRIQIGTLDSEELAIA